MDLPVLNWYSIYASSKKLKKLYKLPYNLKITACIYGISTQFLYFTIIKMNELKEKIKKLELELEDVKSARDCLVRYSQGLYNKILELEDELDKKNEIIAKIQSIIAK